MKLFPRNKDEIKSANVRVRYCGNNYDATVESISKTGDTIKAYAGGNLHTFKFSENTDLYHTGNGYTLIVEM